MPKNKTGLIVRAKTWLQRALNLNSVVSYSSGGWNGMWWPGAILESFSGAWQTNVVAAPTSTLLSFSPVYACVTGIAQDIGKMRVKLSLNNGGIWEEITENQPWLSLLRKPNHYQTRAQFFETWMLSKLMYGNAYILKERDARGVVRRLYVLHPSCIRALVAEDGSVFYELKKDDLAGLTDEKLDEIEKQYGRFAIPESEMIHDRMNTLWHQLVGVSPLYACGASATLGTAIQSNSTKFYQNRSTPGGMLSAPGAISDETATRLKTTFESNFSGDNIGKLLVVGDGLEFKQFSVDAEKAQTKEQLDQAVADVARAFRYPLWKLGGPQPPYSKPDQAQTMYYTDCLGVHIVAIEECLDNGLELPLNVHCEFDLDELMRMDQTALFESLTAAGKFMKLDEQRFRANLVKLPKGGDTVYRQEQDHSVEFIHDMDRLLIEKGVPEAPSTPAPMPAPKPEAETVPEREALPLEAITVMAEHFARTA